MVSPGGPASQFLPLEHLLPFPYKVYISHVQEDIIYFIFQIRYWDKMGGPASQYPTELPPPHTRVNSLLTEIDLHCALIDFSGLAKFNMMHCCCNVEFQKKEFTSIYNTKYNGWSKLQLRRRKNKLVRLSNFF